MVALTKKVVDKDVLQPKSHEYEFGGMFGTAFVTTILPLTAWGVLTTCDDKACFGLLDGPSKVVERLGELTVGDFLSVRAFAIVIGWFAYQYALTALLPGPKLPGVVLRDGSQLKYKLNAHLVFWVSFFGLFTAWPQFTDDWTFVGLGMAPFAILYDEMLAISTSLMIVSTVLSFYLYVTSFRPDAMLALGGNTGNHMHDFFIGRELNPRIGDFDLKQWCELRPGLSGWIALNIGCAAKQYELTGTITPAMIAVNFFQALYVWDSVLFEKAILTTMDITTDGFGFMLAFGDLAWVPSVYGLQARFLVSHAEHGLDGYPLLAVTLLMALGYTIFRGANLTKDRFRSDPSSVPHIEWMPTKRGTKLMVSGWWGLARKINYTGDWTMSWAMSLTTGFVSPIPYFYPIYFAVLLIHRAYRDDHACKEKYGDDWKTYKKRVPAVFIPGVI